MILGAMQSVGVGLLYFIKIKINIIFYQENLEHFMLLSSDKLHEDLGLLFQLGLAPAQSAQLK